MIDFFESAMDKLWNQSNARNLNPDLCNAGAVLYQLSYQANWELVIMCVYDKPIDSGYLF